MSLYTIPFAESILMEDDVPLDPWMNDLQEFPPLTTATKQSPLSTRSSSSSSSSCKSSNSEWDIISTAQDDDWIDLYSERPTFADVAEAAGVHHEPISTQDPSLISLRWSYYPSKHSYHEQDDAEDFYDDDYDYDSLSNDLYEHHKSQSRIATRRIPYIQRHRHKVQEITLRRDLRSLPQVHEKFNRRLNKAENAMAMTCAKRDMAHNNWRHALLLECPINIQKDSTLPPLNHQIPRATVRVPYTVHIKKRLKRRRNRAVAQQVYKLGTDMPAEYMKFYSVLRQELWQRQLLPSTDSRNIVEVALDAANLGWRYCARDLYGNNAFLYHEMKKLLVTDLRYWHMCHYDFEECKVSHEEYYEYMRELRRIVSQEFKPNSDIGYYPSKWLSYSRLLTALYLKDIFETNAEQRRLKNVLDDINNKDALKTLYKVISRNGSTRASSRDKQLRKHLIQHFLNQWTSCK